MSPKCLPIEARRQVIKDNILHCSYEELATKCGCSKRTIVRTINDWRNEGGFEELLFNEFTEVYPIVKAENPDKALDKVVYLLSRNITRKAEIKTEQKTEHTERLEVTLNRDNLSKDERELMDRVARKFIKAEHTTEPATIH